MKPTENWHIVKKKKKIVAMETCISCRCHGEIRLLKFLIDCTESVYIKLLDIIDKENNSEIAIRHLL